MFAPEVFRRSVFDDFFDRPFGAAHAPAHAMKTDVRETDQGFELLVDLPGVKKEDVKAELHSGYLTISASTASENSEQDKDGRYIRRERYSGSYSRSFFVGEQITEEDIRARFADGVLHLEIPKKEPAAPAKKYIAIEG